MKIAIDVSQVIYGTGVSRYLSSLIPALLRQSTPHQFLLFGGALRGRRQLSLWLNRQKKAQTLTHLLSPEIANLLWNNLHLLPVESLIGQVDLLHTSDWAEPPSKIPKVTTVHDLSFFVDPDFTASSVKNAQKKRLYWVSNESKGIIAVSQATKNDLIKYLDIPSGKIDVIGEGPTLEPPLVTDVSSVLAILDRYHLKPPYLLVPGCGHPRKNIPRIVKAFQKLNLPHKLAIIGRPTVAELPLASAKVIFTGFISDADLSLVFASADALIYPSLYEGFGLPILDAFVTATPVLTSTVSSLPEAAGRAAILVDPTDTADIAAGITKVLADKTGLIRAGHEQLQKFSWEIAAKETLRFYERVYNQSKSSI